MDQEFKYVRRRAHVLFLQSCVQNEVRFIVLVYCFVFLLAFCFMISLRADMLLGPLMLYQLFNQAVSHNRAEVIFDVLTVVHNLVIALPGSTNYKRVIRRAASTLTLRRRRHLHHL